MPRRMQRSWPLSSFGLISFFFFFKTVQRLSKGVLGYGLIADLFKKQHFLKGLSRGFSLFVFL